jgi:hypothetical protein
MAEDHQSRCILLERMAKVETKLWCVIALLGALILVLTLVTFKLLNAQTLMLVGERGLHAVSSEARSDIQIIRKAVK